MSPLRLVFYLQFLLLLPFLFYWNMLFTKNRELDLVELERRALEIRLIRYQERGALNQALSEHYKGKEVRKREQLASQKLFKEVHFIEGRVEKAPLFQEVPVSLAKPLLLNGPELKQLLALFEERTLPPYEAASFPALCLITDIGLQRTEEEGRELFQVTLKLLKREFS